MRRCCDDVVEPRTLGGGDRAVPVSPAAVIAGQSSGPRSIPLTLTGPDSFSFEGEHTGRSGRVCFKSAPGWPAPLLCPPLTSVLSAAVAVCSSLLLRAVRRRLAVID